MSVEAKECLAAADLDLGQLATPRDAGRALGADSDDRLGVEAPDMTLGALRGAITRAKVHCPFLLFWLRTPLPYRWAKKLSSPLKRGV